MQDSVKQNLFNYMVQEHNSYLMDNEFHEIELILGYKQHTQDHFPAPKPGEWFTDDVLAIDENGNTHMIFYNYDMSCWLYSENNGITSHEVDEGVKFNWITLPDYLTKPE